jgi:hypothetical protein
MKHKPGVVGEQAFTMAAPIAETHNTQLAAALCTMGVPFNQCATGAVRFVGDGITAPGGTISWVFSPRSDDGKHSTHEMIKKWSDKAWLTDPTNLHPLAFIACAFHNYRMLLKKIHDQSPLGIVRKGPRFALIDLSSSQHLQDIIFQRL